MRLTTRYEKGDSGYEQCEQATAYASNERLNKCPSTAVAAFSERHLCIEGQSGPIAREELAISWYANHVPRELRPSLAAPPVALLRVLNALEAFPIRFGLNGFNKRVQFISQRISIHKAGQLAPCCPLDTIDWCYLIGTPSPGAVSEGREPDSPAEKGTVGATVPMAIPWPDWNVHGQSLSRGTGSNNILGEAFL